MNNTQQGILAPVPGQARYMVFSLRPDTQPRQSLKHLADIVDGVDCVIGLGESLLTSLGSEIAGMHNFPANSSGGIDFAFNTGRPMVLVAGF